MDRPAKTVNLCCLGICGKQDEYDSTKIKAIEDAAKPGNWRELRIGKVGSVGFVEWELCDGDDDDDVRVWYDTVAGVVTLRVPMGVTVRIEKVKSI